MFQRVGAAAYKADLKNTLAICRHLNHPEKKFKSIHIAGTNGKGSSSHMLASVFQAAGYKTGLYTSPHLKDFRERIKINGKMIPKKYIVDFVKEHKTAFEKIEPSFFEWTVGLAFDYFAKENVDVAIVEVGLGGRLDSTNVITPLVSLITNIGWDHTNLLGNTLKKIAAEKAGIIKPNVPVVISQTQKEVRNVFLKKAKESKSEIYFADAIYRIIDKKREGGILQLQIANAKTNQIRYLNLDLTGTYQEKNILGVLNIIDLIKEYQIKEKHILKGLANVKKLSGLMGRWQIIASQPLTICDTGHNVDGIEEVLKNIAMHNYKKLHFVLGMVNDKDIDAVLNMLPRKAIYYFCKANIPRGMDAGELAGKAKLFGLQGKIYHGIKEALEAAQAKAGKDDLVFVGGSTFTVAEVV